MKLQQGRFQSELIKGTKFWGEIEANWVLIDFICNFMKRDYYEYIGKEKETNN